MVKQFYPKQIAERSSRSPGSSGDHPADGVGSTAAVECGTFVRFEICLDSGGNRLSRPRPRTNGCGFMIAAADVVAETVEGKRLTELHGLSAAELTAVVEHKLGKFPPERMHCLTAAIDALRSAFADLRRRRVEEFTGEKALVCTCFSVTEDTIEDLVTNHRKSSVSEIGDACQAGTGCGSCQPIIQDMLDVLNADAV